MASKTMAIPSPEDEDLQQFINSHRLGVGKKVCRAFCINLAWVITMKQFFF